MKRQKTTSRAKLPQKEIWLQRAIVEALNYSGCLVWRTNAGRIPSTYKGRTRLITIGVAGTSDIIGIHKGTGRFIAIEVKKPETRGNVTDLQRQFLQNIEEANGYAGVATSIEEALAIIKKYQEMV